MRFMMLVKSAETGLPSPELIRAIGDLSREMAQAGVLVAMGGLAPSVQGARIRLSGGKLTVTDGPFTESKEVVGGYSVLNAGSRAEALELGRRFMQLHADILGPGHEVELEIREVFDAPVSQLV